jgi:hypothetical protein
MCQRKKRYSQRGEYIHNHNTYTCVILYEITVFTPTTRWGHSQRARIKQGTLTWQPRRQSSTLRCPFNFRRHIMLLSQLYTLVRHMYTHQMNTRHIFWRDFSDLRFKNYTMHKFQSVKSFITFSWMQLSISLSIKIIQIMFLHANITTLPGLNSEKLIHIMFFHTKLSNSKDWIYKNYYLPI